MQEKTDCPLNGACLTDGLVYKAEVKTPGFEPKVYLGMAECPFKTRYNNHKSSIKNEKQASSTTLSKFIWDLKATNTTYSINWSTL